MKSSPKQTDYPIYSEGKLSERKQLFHLSLRNRLPALRQTPISESDTDSQNDERQALKRIVVFFAVMLILTLVARGTSSAIRPVVTTQQAKAGTISQSVQSSGSITASSVLSVSLPEGIVLDNILVKEGQSVVEGQTLATCDVDELSTKLDRAKASLQKSKAEYNQLLSNAVLDDTSVARTQQALLRAYEADQKAYEELEKLRASENPAPEAISTAEQAADDAHWAAQQAEYDRNSALASYQEMQRQNNLSAQVNQASAEDVALDIKDGKPAIRSAVSELHLSKEKMVVPINLVCPFRRTNGRKSCFAIVGCDSKSKATIKRPTVGKICGLSVHGRKCSKRKMPPEH